MTSGETTVSTPANDLTLVRARATCAAGRMAWFERDLRKARALTEESVTLFQQVNDSPGLLNALSSLMMVLSWQGEDEEAQARLQQGMSIVRTIETPTSWLPVLSNFGWAASFTSSPRALEDAWNLNRQIEALAREANDKRGLAWALDSLGMCCYFRREYEQGRQLLSESAELFRELGELWAVSQIGFGLGNISIEEGRYEQALVEIEDSLNLQIQQNNWVGYPYTLEMYAYLAVAQEQSLRAAKLLGATEKIRETNISARQPFIQSLYERNMVSLRAQLAPQELETAWMQGRALSSQALLHYAMAVPNAKNI